MTAIALKGIRTRKLRTLLTGLAVVLGVAVVSGAYIITDTWLGAADKLSSAAYSDVDAVVTSRAAFKVDTESSTSDRRPVGAGLLETVRAVPGVGAAAGTVDGQARLVGRDGKALGSDGGQTFATGIDPGAARLTPFRLRAGRFPRADGEVAIDAATAEQQHLRVGDRLGVSARGPMRDFRIVGTATFGSVESIGGATAAIFSLRQAQALLKKQGRLDAIVVAARDGVAPQRLRRDIAAALPPTAQVGSAEAQDIYGIGDLKDGLHIFRTVLLVFGWIALFVGGFVILNTLSITVAQRAREFAMLRTVGASRRQVLACVVVEAAATGFLASLVGLAVGLGLTAGLLALFRSVGVDLPDSGTALAARTVVVSMLLGVGVTTVAGIVPALRATRIEPVAVLRGESARAGHRSRRALAAGALAALLGVGALTFGMFAGGIGASVRLYAIAGGALSLFVGVAMLAPWFAEPLASALGRPAARIAGVAGKLARQNAMRNPGRTAATAAALMIGVALVTFVAVFGQGLRTSFEGTLDNQLTADYVVTGKDGYAPVVAEVGDALRAAPGVAHVTTVRQDQIRAFGERQVVDGVDPAVIGRMVHFDWKAGSPRSLAQLGTGGAVVTERYASEHHLGVGEKFVALTPTGERLRLTVRGIDDRPRFNPLELADVTISRALFDRSFATREDRYVFAEVRAGETPAQTRALAKAIAGFPDAQLDTYAGFRDRQLGELDSFLGLVYVLLALSVIVSLFGIVNTLALSVYERTRELGTLRAVGMTRRQARRMVRHESVIVALIGAVLGMGVGLFLGALVTRALAGEGLSFAVPFGTLVVFGVVAVVAGMLAAILPARRAARLNVLAALQYE